MKTTVVIALLLMGLAAPKLAFSAPLARPLIVARDDEKDKEKDKEKKEEPRKVPVPVKKPEPAPIKKPIVDDKRVRPIEKVPADKRIRPAETVRKTIESKTT